MQERIFVWRHLSTYNTLLIFIIASPEDGRMLQATLELQQYAKRLAIVWLAIFTAVSGPIAYQTFDPSQQAHNLPLALATSP